MDAGVVATVASAAVPATLRQDHAARVTNRRLYGNTRFDGGGSTATCPSMYATVQTAGAGPVYYPIIDRSTKRHRVPTMKHTLQLEVVKVRRSNHVRGNPGPRAAVRDSARIQGGNWSMQGFRRSVHVHDEDECQMSIAEFMAEQAPPRSSDDA